jgi:RHS repeat-associated protein
VSDLYEKRVNGSAIDHVMYVGARGKIVAQVMRRQGGSESVQFLHGDRLGSVDAVTDAAGAVVEQTKRDPYGNRVTNFNTPVLPGTITATSNKVRLGFTGHEQDDELGLVNMRGRMYDPRLGRFVSADPLVSRRLNGQSYNRYAYVLNNPTRYLDPTGFEAEYCQLFPNDPTCGPKENTPPDEELKPGYQWEEKPPGSNTWVEECIDAPECVTSIEIVEPPPPSLTNTSTSGTGIIVGGSESSGSSGGGAGSGTPQTAGGASGQGSSPQPEPTPEEPNAPPQTPKPAPPPPKAKVTLVTRSIGGEGKKLSKEQHAGLIIQFPGQKGGVIVQGGPTGPNGTKLTGSAQSTPDPFGTFSQAKGADWNNPSSTRTLTVNTVATVEVAGLTPENLIGQVNAMNGNFGGSNYNYEDGPNSNTYVSQFLNELGVPQPAPPNTLGWNWSPP